MKNWGIGILIMGFVLLLTYVVLILINHEGTGLIGGGLGLVAAGITLIQRSKRNKPDL